jgi:hypothetical protein
MKAAFAATASVLTMLSVAAPISTMTRAAPSSASPAAGDLSGLYSCTGKTAGGRGYRGAVEIVRHENTYQLLWMLPPEEPHLGIGIVGADRKDLAVSYFGELPGVVIYRIDRSDGATRLVGEWTEVAADGEIFSEELVRIGPGSGHLYFKMVPPKTDASRGMPRRPA